MRATSANEKSLPVALARHAPVGQNECAERSPKGEGIVMPTDILPTVDYAFKRLFGSASDQELLIDLLNAVHQFPPGKRVRDVTLRNPFSVKEYDADKVAIFDIVAVDQGGQQHHLEMQWQVPWSFGMRAIYYCARLHSQQLIEGEVHETLRPTLSVCILNQAFFEDAFYHHKFGLWDREHGLLLGKDIEIHLIELPKFNRPAEGCQTPLERWCYFLKHGATLDADNLPASLNVPTIRKALEVLKVLSQDQIERQRYEDRLKAQRDAATREYFSQNAHRLGLEKGLEEGREQGEVVGRIQLAQRLLRQTVTPREELLRLPPEELATLAQQLEQQLLPPTNGTS
jgi:predicted transposase/invertase (TIGR01784 family)